MTVIVFNKKEPRYSRLPSSVTQYRPYIIPIKHLRMIKDMQRINSRAKVIALNAAVAKELRAAGVTVDSIL